MAELPHLYFWPSDGIYKALDKTDLPARKFVRAVMSKDPRPAAHYLLEED